MFSGFQVPSRAVQPQEFIGDAGPSTALQPFLRGCTSRVILSLNITAMRSESARFHLPSGHDQHRDPFITLANNVGRINSIDPTSIPRAGRYDQQLHQVGKFTRDNFLLVATEVSRRCEAGVQALNFLTSRRALRRLLAYRSQRCKQ